MPGSLGLLMPNQHAVKAVTFRPATAEERDWLIRHAEATGRDANAVLREALADYRSKHDTEEND